MDLIPIFIMDAKHREQCHPILNGKYEICKIEGDYTPIKLRWRVSKNEIPSKNCDNRTKGRGMQQGKINAPTFAYQTVYGRDPPQFLRGRTNSPKKLWKGLYVDEGLKDEWLEDLNALPIDIRSSEEGKNDLRPAFVMFRMPPDLDDLHQDMTEQLGEFSDLITASSIGQGARPRICVANKLTKHDPEWEKWWNELPSKIKSSYERTLEKNEKQFTFDDLADLERKYVELARKEFGKNPSCAVIRKDANIIGNKDVLNRFGC